MRLLYCLECHDVVKLKLLDKEWCECGCSYGYFDATGVTIYSAEALVLEISNTILDTCLKGTLRRPGPAGAPGYSTSVHVLPINSSKGRRLGQ